MKVDKILQEAVKKQEKEILDKDKDFCDTFIKEHYDNNSSKIEIPNIKKSIYKTRRFWMSFCSAFILVVCLTTFLGIWIAKDGDQRKYYSKDNCQGVASTLEELNKDLQFSKIKVSENYELIVVLNYDIVSGDHLYYNLKLSSKVNIEVIDLIIYVNNDYHYDNVINGQTENTNINNFVIKYLYKCEVDADGIYAHSVTANLVTAYEKYRIDYLQMNFEENYEFKTFIENCILPK